MKKIVCLIAGLLLATMVATSCDKIEMPPVQTTPSDTTVGETVGDGQNTLPSNPDGTSKPVDPDTPDTPDTPDNPDTPSDTMDSNETNEPSTPIDPDHTHTFDEHWTNDDTDHWHASACEHGDVVADKAPHVDEDGNDVCDVCGFRKKHVHTYEETWTISEKTHYHKNTCGHDDVEKYRQDEAKHTDKNNDGLCDVCGYDYGHTHTYDTETWTKTENGHWHVPTCGHDIPGIDLTEHVDADNNAICDGCAYDYDHTHSWSDKWTHDQDYHWHDVTCGHSIPVADKNAHVDDNGDKKCDLCGYQPPHIHEFDTSKWVSDASGHWHASSCGHDVRQDETGHDGYEVDGVCDTCRYVVFHFYTVNVTLPEESVSIKAPDGSDALSFEAKEGTDVVFHLTLPRFIELVNMKGATITGTPVMEGDNHTYTVTVSAIKRDTNVTMELKKNSNVQVIVDFAEESLEVTKKYTSVTGTVTFTIPSAGRYIIYADNSDVRFSLAGNTTPQDDTSDAYIFDAQAGEITLDCTYFPWEVPADNQMVYHYVVARVEKDTTLDRLEGNGCIMPTNYAVNVTYHLPSAGFYQITSSIQVSINGDVTQPSMFYASEENYRNYTIAIKYDSDTEPQFIFDWKIEAVKPIADLALSASTNFVVKKGEYSALTFTAPLDGAYFFTTGDKYAILHRWTVEEWGSYFRRLGSYCVIEELKAGETITIFVTTDPYADESEVSGDIQSSTYVAYAPGADGKTMVGGDNAFVSESYEDIEYTLTAVNGDLVSIDGGETWHEEIITVIPAYSVLYYQAQSATGADTATVYVGKTTYDIRLNLGENPAADMIAGQEYNLYLSGAESQGYYASYILSWTDPNITVTYAGHTITSGSEITNYHSDSSNLTAVYNGTTDGSVVFTLAEGTFYPPETDPETPDDSDGSEITADVELKMGIRQSIEITDGNNGVSVMFKAPVAGTYKLQCPPTETNAIVIVENENSAEEVTMPYEVTLAEGEVFQFILCTKNWEPDTILIMINKT